MAIGDEQPYGADPKGSMFFDAAGHYSVVVVGAAGAGAIAYFGEYTLDEPAGALTLHVDASNRAGAAGRDEKRLVQTRRRRAHASQRPRLQGPRRRDAGVEARGLGRGRRRGRAANAAWPTGDRERSAPLQDVAAFRPRRPPCGRAARRASIERRVDPVKSKTAAMIGARPAAAMNARSCWPCRGRRCRSCRRCPTSAAGRRASACRRPCRRSSQRFELPREALAKATSPSRTACRSRGHRERASSCRARRREWPCSGSARCGRAASTESPSERANCGEAGRAADRRAAADWRRCCRSSRSPPRRDRRALMPPSATCAFVDRRVVEEVGRPVGDRRDRAAPRRRRRASARRRRPAA